MKNQKGSSGLELVISIVVTLFLLGIAWIGSVIWNSYACSNYGDLTDRVTKYSIVNGCFVDTPSGWIPQEEMSKRAYGNSVVETESKEGKNGN